MKDKYQLKNCKCERSKKCLPRPPRGAGGIVLPSAAGRHPDAAGLGGPWHPEAGGISPGSALPRRIPPCRARVLPGHETHGAPGPKPSAATPLRVPGG